MFSVSYTTRTPRGAEIDGRGYHFVAREEFERMLACGEFLEWAQVFGNYYGTHRCILEEARKQGKDLVLDIDVQGARQLKAKIPAAVTVFILAPSRQVLEQRLRARSEDRDDVIARRLREAAEEIRIPSLRLCFDHRELAERPKQPWGLFAPSARLIRIEDQIRPILIHLKIEVQKQMADKAPRNNAHCTLPDDPEQSTYRFIIVAAKRARQLQGGARPVLPTSSKKPTVIAMEEVRRGLVKYELTGPLVHTHQAPPEPAS